jgi:hypothetical protein
MNIFNLAQKIYQENFQIGWWHDFSGNDITQTRNRLQLLMLTVGELFEASIGYHDNLYDDKLQNYKMLDVELADAIIRACDILGADIKTHNLNEDFFNLKIIENIAKQSHFDKLNIKNAPVDNILMKLVNILSISAEYYRKDNVDMAVTALYCFIDKAINTSKENIYFTDKFENICKEKREYNRKRLDHKIENRKLHGGKKT